MRPDGCPILFRLAVVAGLIGACSPRVVVWHGTAYDSPPPARELVGETTTNDPLTVGTPSENVTLVYFGYTHCPDFCPATMAVARELFEQLGPQADRVRFVFVTVDPKRDTMPVLADYVSTFDSRFIGVRPTPEDLPDLLASYGAAAFVDLENHDPSEEPVIAHTTRVFLIDQAGRLRVHYPFDTRAEDLRLDVQRLLEEG
jgi:protein SCO1/2